MTPKERAEARRLVDAATEVRKPIPGFPSYSADVSGRIWSDRVWRGKQNRALSMAEDEYGYLRTRLVVDGVRVKKAVHTLVAITFLGPKPSGTHQVRHLNGDKKDNRPDNLAWGTAGDNGADKVRLGESATGSSNGQSVLVESDVSVIKTMLELGLSQYVLAALFDVQQTTIYRIGKNETWANVVPARTLVPQLLDALEAAKRERDEARTNLGEQMAAHGAVYINIAVELRAERDTARAQVATLAEALRTYAKQHDGIGEIARAALKAANLGDADAAGG